MQREWGGGGFDFYNFKTFISWYYPFQAKPGDFEMVGHALDFAILIFFLIYEYRCRNPPSITQ